MAHVNWNNPHTGKRAQFIADVIKESLFDYAFDSNKIPSLNLHYFCKDYLTTYNLVKKGVMRPGNLIPLNEEFENIIQTALWLPAGITTSIFFFRGKSGEYQDVIKDKNIDELKRGEYYSNSANYISSLLSANIDYYDVLLNEIEKTLNASQFDVAEQRKLYYCVREAICELVNIGVSKSHIYNLVQNKLFSAIKPDDDIGYIMSFLHSLIPEENKYLVVFGVTDETFFELNDTFLTMRNATDYEKSKLNVNYVVSIEIESTDPVSALEVAKSTFLTLLSVYNAFVHSEDITIVDDGLVKKEGEQSFRKINAPSSIMKRNLRKPKDERLSLLRKVVVAGESDVIVSSFELHNIAVTSKNPETQLLMLWTILELLIETNQDTMSKVNFITNSVSAVLCANYYRHIVETLYKQITTTRTIKPIILKETRGTSNIEKLAFILKDNSSLQNEIINKLSDYPLESFKIKHYHDIFSTPEKMEKDLKRHSKRLRWQLMRIYRNRCMIVHDGSHLPYINNITENLHFYVDDLLEYMISCFGNGITDPSAILSDARIKEKHILDVLGDKANALSDQEFIKIICPINR